MIEFLPSASDVIAARFQGDIEKDDFAAYVAKVEASLEANDRTHLFVEIADFDGIDWDDISPFIGKWFVILGKLRRFGRIAFVSDDVCLRWAATIESAILPYVSYETYLPEEREQALAWVEGERTQPRDPSIKLIETSKSDVLGYELNGKVTAAELHAVSTQLNAIMDEGRPLRLLKRIKRLQGFEPAGLFDREYLAMKRGALERVERYAIVGGPDWLASWIKVLDPLFKTEIRHFKAEEEALAWAWLGAEPKQERPLVA